MTKNKEGLHVLDADTVPEGLLVHFSNGISVLYHAQFLFDVRDDDGNIAIPDQIEPEA